MDWIVSNQPGEKPEILEAWVSDHKALKWRIQVGRPVEAGGSLQPTPKWRKPVGISPETWRRILEEELEQLCQNEGAQQFENLMKNSEIDVEREWEAWNDVMDTLMRNGTKRIIDQMEIPIESLKTLTTNIEAKTKKGNKAKHVSRRQTKAGKVEDKTVEQRKRRKWIARASQLLRKIEEEGETAAEGTKMRMKVEKRLDALEETAKSNRADVMPAHSLETRLRRSIEGEKQEMTKIEEKQRKHQIQAWKEKMKEGLPEVARWMRNRKQGQTPTLHRNGIDALTREEACNHIAAHWEEVWNENSASDEEVKRRANLIAKEIQQPEIHWTRPTYENFVAKFRKASGSGGTDGWEGAELKHLPAQAIYWFADMTARWEEKGACPKVMQEARQCNLPKAKKIKHGSMEAGNARPISVFNSLWRIYVATWLSCDSWKAWGKAVIPPRGDVVGGPGSQGAEEAASELFGEFAKEGYFATVDYSQCFDRMDARISIAILEELGFPPGLTSVLQQVWVNQLRYLSWEGHTSSRTLRAHCMPQGDPVSPFMLNLWMKAGSKAVRERLSPEPGRFEKTYMDDRSWTDRNPERLIRAVLEWQNWSAKIGLKENEEKTQLAGWDAKKTTRLKTVAKKYGLEEKVVPAVEALGVFSGAGLGEKEKDRLEAAASAAKTLQSIPGGRQYKLMLARSLALSKATYGWVRKGPPKGQAEKVDKQILQVTKYSKASKPWLRRMMEGGTSTLQIVVVQRQVAMAGRRLAQRPAGVE